MSVLTRLLTGLRSTVTYVLLFFGLSVLAILATTELLPPPEDVFSQPDDVTRQDSWPTSKQRHMQEDDFWYAVEQWYAEVSTDENHWTSSLLGPDLEGNPTIDRWRAQVPWLSEFHQWEMFVWCFLAPLLTYLVLGAGIAAHRRTSWIETALGMLALLGMTAYVWTQPSEALYFTMWDASIYWTNWLGWNYYDFNVRFFVYAPLAAMGVGLLLLIVRGGQEARRWFMPMARSDTSKTEASQTDASKTPAA